VGEPVPSQILDALQVAFRSIEARAAYYQGTGLLRSCMWTQAGVPREQMEISVAKLGKGIQVTYGYGGARGHAVQNFPARFKVDLYDN
jgi:hypothetical protein